MRSLFRIGACALLAGCLTDVQTTLAPLPAGGTHVLFIGNSLTYVNDLPTTLSDMALTTGDTIRVAMVAFPNYALVDHIAEGTAATAIRLGGWKYVVLQQGPSSTQINRDSLILVTRLFDTEIRKVGGTTALFSVWPQLVNYSTFDRAIESYRLAAEAVNGLYLPAGAAWQSALAATPSLPLYADDGLHPTPLGTYLAAAVMYERITGKDARLLTARAVVAGNVVGASVEVIRQLQQVAHDVNTRTTAP